MRESKREAILAAASTVVQEEGVTALSYESVAAAAGMTKGGLLYHFPSREKLLLALHEHVAGTWEAELEQEAGGPAEELSAAQRLGAYIRLTETPDRAELLLMLEATEDPQAHRMWEAVYNRWSPAAPVGAGSPAGFSGPEGDADDPESAARADPASEAEAVDAFIARLAADGLWFYEALSTHRLDASARERLVQRISALGAAQTR